MTAVLCSNHSLNLGIEPIASGLDAIRISLVPLLLQEVLKLNKYSK